jgi:branched-chain amino acid transport system ATP-binding protein
MDAMILSALNVASNGADSNGLELKRRDAKREEGPLLKVQGLSVRFGSIQALADVSFTVERNQVCGIIGPNGAGKTTLFNALSGLVPTHDSEILLNGNSLHLLPSHRVAHVGLGRTFQNLALFESMTVVENVLTGGFVRSKTSILSDTLRLPAATRAEASRALAVDRLIKFFHLGPYRDTRVGTLPFGIRKRVEFARALAGDPILLLLDEPAAGLNHDELTVLEETIRATRKEFNLSILLVEHHMGFVMRLCDKIIALNFGTKIDEGSPKEIQTSPSVIEAYLGEPSQHVG